MAINEKNFKLIKEQLIALCASKVLKKGEEEFSSFLNEDLHLKNFNAGMLTKLCYYTVGMIDIEKRDTLIQWPIVNSQRRSQFRKGIIALVNDFEKRYPWANIMKLQGIIDDEDDEDDNGKNFQVLLVSHGLPTPTLANLLKLRLILFSESFFIQPHGQTTKILDFLIRLTNLAIHLFLDDPELLMTQSIENLTLGEVDLMFETVSTAIKHEEAIIRKTILPLKDYEDIQNEMSAKCIYLTQENDKLQQELSKLHKNAIYKSFVKPGTKLMVDDLRKIKDEKLSELNTINEDLKKYYEVCKKVSSKLKAMENRTSLTAKHFGFENSPVNLSEATSKVCENLYQLFENINSKICTKEEINLFSEELKKVQSYLIQENNAYKSFFLKISPLYFDI